MTPNSRLMAPDSFMHRCMELARLGSGYVAPNPMVGAILVHNNRIIGEGWHQQFGGAHAEVNCIASVNENEKSLISASTLYVSLEPCCHFGKTPPCTDLIIENKIHKLIIGCRDPNEEVKGFEKLEAAGVDVEMSCLEKECEELNKRFFTFHNQHRPYIILKWAQTSDGFIGTSPQTPLRRRGAFENSEKKRLYISNENTNRLVHKWRSEEASILIGTNTAMLDDPELTNRYWKGLSPVRLVLDTELKLPASLRIFDGTAQTIIFNIREQEEKGNPSYYRITTDANPLHQVIKALYQLNILSVIVEGGRKLLQSFLDENLWDEARVITNSELRIGDGLAAPKINGAVKVETQKIQSDRIEVYKANPILHSL